MARKTSSLKKKSPYLKKRSNRPCYICANKIEIIDYKDLSLIQRFQSDRGKIMGRKHSHVCAKHQRLVTIAIKRARAIGLVPYQLK